jgi:hypothetical protein
VGIRSRMCWSLAAVVSLVVMLAPAAVAQARAARVYTSVHKGVLYPVRSMGRARHAPASFTPALTALGPPISRGARRLPRSNAAVNRNAPAGPSASGESLSSPSAASALTDNFNGVSSRDSELTNFGQEFEPPDQGLCEGNGFVVEMVNSAYKVYKPNGVVVTGPFNINGPFDEGLTEFTSDPRCTYDAATNTWFASILFINAAGNQSFEDLAVNTSGDPTKLWTVYRINTTDIGGSTGPKHPGCPCLGDQPRMGIDAHNVYISTDEFSILGTQYNGPQIYAIAKSSLVNPGPPSTPARFVHFDNLSIGGTVPIAVQPAIVGSGGTEYFMNSLDPNGTFDQRLGVWAMTNVTAVANGGTPKLSSTVIPSEAYAIPPGAEQRGSNSLLDSGDDRMQQVQAIGGTLWGELDTSITIPGDSEARAGGAWFNVRPAVTNGVISSAKVTRQGYVASAGNYVLYPAVQAAPSGKVAMVFTLSGAGRFPSAAYAVMGPGATHFGPIAVAGTATTHYDPNATRWGDYSYATLDPTGTQFWMATEYMPPPGSQTTDHATNWGTRVFSLGAG